LLHYQVLENKEPRKFSELKLSTKLFFFVFKKKGLEQEWPFGPMGWPNHPQGLRGGQPPPMGWFGHPFLFSSFSFFFFLKKKQGWLTGGGRATPMA
jgi:hypothetical protein